MWRRASSSGHQESLLKTRPAAASARLRCRERRTFNSRSERTQSSHVLWLRNVLVATAYAVRWGGEEEEEVKKWRLEFLQVGREGTV